MSTTRLDEIGISLLSNLFTSRLNALGIANLPTAIDTLRAAWKDGAKRKKGWIIYGSGIFNALVVISGVTGRWPDVIKVNAALNIVNGVKESIAARKNAEFISEDELNRQVPKKRSILSGAIKNRFFSSKKDPMKDPREEKEKAEDSTSTCTTSETTARKEEVNVNDSTTTSSFKNRFYSSQKDRKDSTTSNTSTGTQEENLEQDSSRRKKSLEKAKAMLAGKRESAFDDIVWGVFQISFVLFDVGRWQAIGHAWMVFLLHVLDGTVFNEKLSRKQKTRKIAYLTITAYVSGRLVFK